MYAIEEKNVTLYARSKIVTSNQHFSVIKHTYNKLVKLFYLY